MKILLGVCTSSQLPRCQHLLPARKWNVMSLISFPGKTGNRMALLLSTACLRVDGFPALLGCRRHLTLLHTTHLWRNSRNSPAVSSSAKLGSYSRKRNGGLQDSSTMLWSWPWPSWWSSLRGSEEAATLDRPQNRFQMTECLWEITCQTPRHFYRVKNGKSQTQPWRKNIRNLS